MAPPIRRTRPELLALLRSISGTRDEQVRRALALLAEDLGMRTAYVARFRAGERVITHVARLGEGGLALEEGDVRPEQETLCHLIAIGSLEPVIPDASDNSLIAAAPLRPGEKIGAHVGLPLRVDGEVAGAVCCADPVARPDLRERDLDTVTAISDYIETVLSTRPSLVPGPREPGAIQLPELAAAASGESLEELTRPLLEILQQVTGLETTYLTMIDWAEDKQRIVYSNNQGDLQIPEGLRVDWEDTLCKRALDEGRQYTPNVPEVWGDSEAAAALGIRTYVSVPVLDQNDGVVGTICGISSRSEQLDERNLQAMHMFARLISGQIARETALAAEQARAMDLEERTRMLSEQAARDPLTGALNRSGVMSWLSAVLPVMRPELERLAVAFIDVDRFKSINDTYGHGVGDQVLKQLAVSLEEVGRNGDLIGRLGGDEFVVGAVLPATGAAFGGWTGRVQRAAVTRMDDLVVTATVGAVSIGDPEATNTEVLELADAAMYRLKHRTRAFS